MTSFELLSSTRSRCGLEALPMPDNYHSTEAMHTISSGDEMDNICSTISTRHLLHVGMDWMRNHSWVSDHTLLCQYHWLHWSVADLARFNTPVKISVFIQDIYAGLSFRETMLYLSDFKSWKVETIHLEVVFSQICGNSPNWLFWIILYNINLPSISRSVLSSQGQIRNWKLYCDVWNEVIYFQSALFRNKPFPSNAPFLDLASTSRDTSVLG